MHLICNACPCGNPHKWTARVQDFWQQGTGCPYCSGRRPCTCNSFMALHPGLCQQWDHEKNTRPPSDFLPGSGHRAWWICDEHHPPNSWQVAIHDRARSEGCRATGCPKCAADRRLGKGKRTKQPTVAEAETPLDILKQQWHPDNDCTAKQVTLGSEYKALWLCPMSECKHPHVWAAAVTDRARTKLTCPFCSGSRVCPCNSLQHKAPQLSAQWDHAANKNWHARSSSRLAAVLS